MNVEGLLRKLFSVKYKSATSHYEYPVISREHEDKIETAVREWAIENDNKKDVIIASLEAKISVYEAVIGKSNFGPLIAPVIDKVEDDCK